jgi:hypothetical protein
MSQSKYATVPAFEHYEGHTYRGRGVTLQMRAPYRTWTCDPLRVMRLGAYFWCSVMSNFVSLAECQRHRAGDATIARVRTRECDLAKSDGARSQ